MEEIQQQTLEQQRRKNRKIALILAIVFVAILLIIGASLQVFFLIGVAVFMFAAVIFIYMLVTRNECGAVSQNVSVPHTAQWGDSAPQIYHPPVVVYQQAVTSTSYGYPQKQPGHALLPTNSSELGPSSIPQVEYMPHSPYVVSGMASNPQQQRGNETATPSYEEPQVTASPTPHFAYPTDAPPSYEASFDYAKR